MKNLVLVSLIAIFFPLSDAASLCTSWPFPQFRNTKINDAYTLQPFGNENPLEFNYGEIYSWRLKGRKIMKQYEVVMKTEPLHCGGGLLPMETDNTFISTECKNRLISPGVAENTEATFKLLAPQCGCFALTALVTDEDGRTYGYFTQPQGKLLINTCAEASSTTETETERKTKSMVPNGSNGHPEIQLPKTEEIENLMEETKDRDAERERSYQMFLQRKKSYERNRRKWRRKQEMMSKNGSRFDSETTLNPTAEDTTIPTTSEMPITDNLFLEPGIDKIFENKKERRGYCCRLGRRSAAELVKMDQLSTNVCLKLSQTALVKLTKTQQELCQTSFKRCCHQVISRN